MEGEHHLRVPFIYSEFESFDSKSSEKSGAHFFGGAYIQNIFDIDMELQANSSENTADGKVYLTTSTGFLITLRRR